MAALFLLELNKFWWYNRYYRFYFICSRQERHSVRRAQVRRIKGWDEAVEFLRPF